MESIGEKGFMVSFEFSVIDIVLMIAIIVLLALYLTKSSTEPRAELEQIREKKTLEKPTAPIEDKKSSEALLTTGVGMERSTKCTHQFGYLKKLPKDASIPDECFTCPKYIRCALEDK